MAISYTSSIALVSGTFKEKLWITHDMFRCIRPREWNRDKYVSILNSALLLSWCYVPAGIWIDNHSRDAQFAPRARDSSRASITYFTRIQILFRRDIFGYQNFILTSRMISSPAQMKLMYYAILYGYDIYWLGVNWDHCINFPLSKLKFRGCARDLVLESNALDRV